MMSEYYEGMPECWDVMNCPEEIRENCPAYPEHGKECWKVTGTKCSQGGHDMSVVSDKILYCRNECRFYKEYIRKNILKNYHEAEG